METEVATSSFMSTEDVGASSLSSDAELNQKETKPEVETILTRVHMQSPME